MAIDVTKAFTPAINHTANVLFRPFEFKKWLGLGLVALLGGATGGGGGGGNGGGDLSDVGSGKSTPDFADYGQWIVSNLPLIIAGLLAVLAISILLNWLMSVMKMVYVDQITRNHGAIREPFARLKELGTSFFWWLLAFGLICMVVLLVLVGLPLFAAFSGGAGTAGEVVAVVWAVIAGVAVIAAMLIINIFAHDFVIPVMYLRNLRVMQAWDVIIPVLRANVGQSALYLLMLIVIGIAGGIGALLVALLVLLVFALPGIALGAIGYMLWQLGGENWSVALIAYTAVFGTTLLLAYLYAVVCAMQPLTVFRRSYALVVLGQADSGLATIPVVLPPPLPPQPPAGCQPPASSG